MERKENMCLEFQDSKQEDEEYRKQSMRDRGKGLQREKKKRRMIEERER